MKDNLNNSNISTVHKFFVIEVLKELLKCLNNSSPHADIIQNKRTHHYRTRFEKKGLHSLSRIKTRTEERSPETLVNKSYISAKLLDLIPAEIDTFTSIKNNQHVKMIEKLFLPEI